MTEDNSVIIGLSAVIVAVTGFEPKVFIVRGAEHALSLEGLDVPEEEADALPFGPFDPANHRTLEDGLRRWVDDQTPLGPGYVEQLYTFGNKGRYAGQKEDGPRVVSVGYLALTFDDGVYTTDKKFWGDWYGYFPWEDWRQGKPEMIETIIEPALEKWVEHGEKADRTVRRERADICFGLNGIGWDDEKVLERYELLYEARLIPEAWRDKKVPEGKRRTVVPGRPMLYDHRRILATAMGRLRGKLKYRPVIFELMPEKFTLLQLQRTVEAIGGMPLHKQNFRRLVENAGLVEETGEVSTRTGGRPASLFRFREEVLMERLAPGVRLSPIGR